MAMRRGWSAGLGSARAQVGDALSPGRCTSFPMIASRAHRVRETLKANRVADVALWQSSQLDELPGI